MIRHRLPCQCLWFSDAVQITCGFMQSSKLIIMKPSMLIEVKISYLMILVSDKGKLGRVGELIQMDTFLYFTKKFQF
jgi:hypothetical protein